MMRRALCTLASLALAAAVPALSQVSAQAPPQPPRLKILVVHGPNLNLLGRREPLIYGTTTLEQIDARLQALAKEINVELVTVQSNHEGKLVDAFHTHMDAADGAIINAAGLTFSSVSIHDAIKAMPFPVIEVHISNLATRDEIHQHSILTPAARGAADTRNGVAQHESVGHALAIIERLGYESGMWDTLIRTDSHIISKSPKKTDGTPASGGPSLSNVDAIFFAGHREVALDDAQKEDLLQFVRDGHGFVAAHTALTAFESWPEFGELIGARFDGHPITGAGIVINESPDFPATRHFPAAFAFNDEFYQPRLFSRDAIDVLLRLDVKPGDTRVHADGDYPLAWAKRYGKGRVLGRSKGAGAGEWLQRALVAAACAALSAVSFAQTPAPPSTRTFIDYFLPMPIMGALTSDIWGAPGVFPRDPKNGLEDPTMKQWCYWDGQIIKGPDGKYHMFASRWDQARGHNGWFGSLAVHAVAETITGPYVDKGLLWPDNQGGKGHNVTALVMPDGRYAVVVSETRPGDVFVSKSLDGPWEHLGAIKVDPNGFGPARMSNLSIMVRPGRRLHDRAEVWRHLNQQGWHPWTVQDPGSSGVSVGRWPAAPQPGRPGDLVQRRPVSHRRQGLE